MLSSSFFGISLIAVLVFLFAGTRRVDAKSVVVDDANTARVTYSTGWKDFNDCTCLVKPTTASAYNGTFHPMTDDGSTDVFFTFTFTGTSVEVRYIAVDIIRTGFVTNTNVSYSIDGVKRGTAVRNPENRNSYIYDQSLFNVTGLTNVEHTLWVDLSSPSVLLLDYIMYEDESADPTNNTNTSSDVKNSTPTTPLGAIIGGTLGGVVLLILGTALVWYLTKKGVPKKQEEASLPADGRPDSQPPNALSASGPPPSRQSAPTQDDNWAEFEKTLDAMKTSTPGETPNTAGGMDHDQAGQGLPAAGSR